MIKKLEQKGETLIEKRESDGNDDENDDCNDGCGDGNEKKVIHDDAVAAAVVLELAVS